jgi:carbon storage regulator
MLVLMRHIGDSLMIGDQIEITVVDIQGDKVKVGINAPKDIRVMRKELLDEVRSSNAQAAEVGVSLAALAQAMAAKTEEK